MSAASVEQTLEWMDELTSIVIEATGAEMRAAASAIARQARRQHPTAARVHLETSDQGDWLNVTGWDPGGGGEVENLDLPENVEDAAAHLYTPHIGTGDRPGAVPGLRCTDHRRGLYVLDVDQVLAECDQTPVLAEVLVTRDPNGSSEIDATVLGRLVHPRWLRVIAVDAGAGWEWPDWVEYRDSCLEEASDALQEPLRQALANPPGGGVRRGPGRAGLALGGDAVNTWIVTYTSMPIEAETAEEAIQQDGSGGGQWDAYPVAPHPKALKAHAAVSAGDADLPVILGAVGGLRLAMYQHRDVDDRPLPVVVLDLDRDNLDLEVRVYVDDAPIATLPAAHK